MSEKITINADKYENGVAYRRCPKCGEMKPIEEFGLRAMKDGTNVTNQSHCKKCR